MDLSRTIGFQHCKGRQALEITSTQNSEKRLYNDFSISQTITRAGVEKIKKTGHEQEQARLVSFPQELERTQSIQRLRNDDER